MFILARSLENSIPARTEKTILSPLSSNSGMKKTSRLKVLVPSLVFLQPESGRIEEQQQSRLQIAFRIER